MGKPKKNTMGMGMCKNRRTNGKIDPKNWVKTIKLGKDHILEKWLIVTTN